MRRRDFITAVGGAVANLAARRTCDSAPGHCLLIDDNYEAVYIAKLLELLL
jgi:hypothetical protein